MLLFLASCGNNETKKTDAVTTDSSAVSTDATAASTIVRTPSNMLFVKHKVADYATFKKVFDIHDSLQYAAGIHRFAVGRGDDDSNTVILMFKVADTAKTKAFVQSPELKSKMKRASVIGSVEILNAVIKYQDTSKPTTNFRSFIMYNVKDWETWTKTFESYRQLRADNGVVDRVYGHSAENDKEVLIIVAYSDTAKAAAFRTSDALKQKRLEGGVISEPERFTFHVVERYWLDD